MVVSADTRGWGSCAIPVASGLQQVLLWGCSSGVWSPRDVHLVEGNGPSFTPQRDGVTSLGVADADPATLMARVSHLLCFVVPEK